jgi:hypothetical protein
MNTTEAALRQALSTLRSQITGTATNPICNMDLIVLIDRTLALPEIPEVSVNSPVPRYFVQGSDGRYSEHRRQRDAIGDVENQLDKAGAVVADIEVLKVLSFGRINVERSIRFTNDE